jgi:hypothetical protein
MRQCLGRPSQQREGGLQIAQAEIPRAASIRATKQSSSEFHRATTDAGDANRMDTSSQ